MKVVVRPSRDTADDQWFEADWVECIVTTGGVLRIELFNDRDQVTGWTVIADGKWDWYRLQQPPSEAALKRRAAAAEAERVAAGGFPNGGGGYPSR